MKKEFIKSLLAAPASSSEFQLVLIKQRLLATPTQPKVVTINAMNEWPEGSCLKPAEKYGYGYLEVIKAIFGTDPSSINNVTASKP